MVSLEKETGFLETQHNKMYCCSMLPISVYGKYACQLGHHNRIRKIFHFTETKSGGIRFKNTRKYIVFSCMNVTFFYIMLRKISLLKMILKVPKAWWYTAVLHVEVNVLLLGSNTFLRTSEWR